MTGLSFEYFALLAVLIGTIYCQNLGSESTPDTGSCLEILRRGSGEVGAEGRTPIGQNCRDLCSGPYGPAADGVFAHPGDCRQYIQCTNWEAEARLCPAFQYFDTTENACTFAATDEEKKNQQCATRVLTPVVVTNQLPEAGDTDEPPKTDTRVASLLEHNLPASGNRRTIRTSSTTRQPEKSTGQPSIAVETTQELTTEVTTALLAETSPAAVADTKTEVRTSTATDEPESEGSSTTEPAGTVPPPVIRAISNNAEFKTPVVKAVQPVVGAKEGSPSGPMQAINFSVRDISTTPKPSSVALGRYYLPGTLYRIKGRRRRVKTARQ